VVKHERITPIEHVNARVRVQEREKIPFDTSAIDTMAATGRSGADPTRQSVAHRAKDPWSRPFL
jgi:hypothetical protein